MTRTIRKYSVTVPVLLVVLILGACGANDSILRSGKETPLPTNAENAATAFARELEAMKTADFRYIFVLRRKDGAKIEAEDRAVIKVNTSEANRRVGADDDKAFIIASNVEIPAAKIAALYDRFAVEDYSPPPVPANTNANANK